MRQLWAAATASQRSHTRHPPPPHHLTPTSHKHPHPWTAAAVNEASRTTWNTGRQLLLSGAAAAACGLHSWCACNHPPEQTHKSSVTSALGSSICQYHQQGVEHMADDARLNLCCSTLLYVGPIDAAWTCVQHNRTVRQASPTLPLSTKHPTPNTNTKPLSNSPKRQLLLVMSSTGSRQHPDRCCCPVLVLWRQSMQPTGAVALVPHTTGHLHHPPKEH